ncbi:Ap-3 Complex Subunit Beta-2 [Manis pentadactyla]|nr:Ap-3 Complex Subunit Beta-2 [Manis pentadactyla]
MPDASGYVERTETLALRKELGSGSDVDGECKMLEQETLALRKELGSGSDVTGVQDVGTGQVGMGDANVPGECAIQFQDYSEAIVVSMVILEFQATGPR